jgi:hypothetical protein
VKKTHSGFTKAVEDLLRSVDVAVKAGAASHADPAQRNLDALTGYYERIQEVICPEVGNM